MSSMIIHPFDSAPFDLKTFVLTETPGSFTISLIVEIPPIPPDNPLGSAGSGLTSPLPPGLGA